MSENLLKNSHLGELFRNGRFYLSDDFSLNFYEWPAATAKVKGVIFYGHGMVEHSGRYADWGKFLAENGFSVFAVDHRGHGRSDGQRLWMDRFSDLVDDFSAFVQAGAARFPDLPVFIAGMSMGGGIAIQATVRLQKILPNLRGTILISPAIRINPALFPLLRFLAPIFDRLCPRLKFIKPGVGGLSRLKEVRSDFLRDPDVCHGRMPVHFGAENIRALRVNRACAPEFSIPTLICQGSGDLITDPSGPVDFIDQMTFPDKTLKIYPKLYHDILHETGKEQIWNDIVAWLNHHLD